MDWAYGMVICRDDMTVMLVAKLDTSFFEDPWVALLLDPPDDRDWAGDFINVFPGPAHLWLPVE